MTRPFQQNMNVEKWDEPNPFHLVSKLNTLCAPPYIHISLDGHLQHEYSLLAFIGHFRILL